MAQLGVPELLEAMDVALVVCNHCDVHASVALPVASCVSCSSLGELIEKCSAGFAGGTLVLA